MRVLALLVLLAALTGCASTTGTFFNRPVVEDQVGDTIRTVSLSADRRTVIVAEPGHPNPRFCAEPPPDTATGIKTDLDAGLTLPGKSATLKDKFEANVTVLAARNAPLDAYRTGVFSLCQFYLNGAIDKDKIESLFTKLLDAYVSTQNAASSADAATKASAITVATSKGGGD